MSETAKLRGWVWSGWNSNPTPSQTHKALSRYRANGAADSTTGLLSGMQAQTAKTGKRTARPHHHLPLPLRPSGHTNCPDGPDRPSGLGRQAGPLGQCAAGVQPAGHPPGDPAAGAAP